MLLNNFGLISIGSLYLTILFEEKFFIFDFGWNPVKTIISQFLLD